MAEGYARNREAEPEAKGRRGRPGRGRKMQPDRIRDSPLRTTKARKDRTRQAGAIRSELFMTSLLKGALETDTEISGGCCTYYGGNRADDDGVKNRS